MWELYRRLHGVVVHVAAGTAAGAAEFDATSHLPTERIPLHFTNWGLWDPRGGWQYVRTLPRLLSVVRRFRPTVIHCGKCLPEGLLAYGIQHLCGVPFCCYAHGEELTLARTSRELRQLTAGVLRAAVLVIANSKFTRRALEDEWGVSSKNVLLMHPGVDTARFVPARPDSEVRERLGWSGRRVVLTVGALQRRKGQDMLIHAMPIIRAKCPDVLYSIAGVGSERSYLDKLVAESHVEDLVQFRGAPNEDELVECYQQCDLFVLANRRVGWDVEGFGIVLLEAQACGKPVVAGRSGGTADTLSIDLTGHLVDGESVSEVADVVIGLLSDPVVARTMGERARQWVVQNFDWTGVARLAEAAFRVRTSTGSGASE